MKNSYFNLSDAELVNLIHNDNDQKAIDALYIRYQRNIRNSAISASSLLSSSSPDDRINEAISESYIAFSDAISEFEPHHNISQIIKKAIIRHFIKRNEEQANSEIPFSRLSKKDKNIINYRLY